MGGIKESNLIQQQQRMMDMAEEANARKVADAEDEISYLSVVFPCLFAPYRDI